LLAVVGRFSDEALARIIELRVRSQLGLEEVGQVLEAERIPTADGARWWPGTVRWLLKQAAAQGHAGAAEALAVRAKRRLGTYRGPNSTPPDVVEQIKALRSTGMSLYEIGEMLEAEGVPTTRGGRRWGPSTVRSVLISAGGYEPLRSRKPSSGQLA
jgi:DNA-binding transcriptional MerR regulator